MRFMRVALLISSTLNEGDASVDEVLRVLDGEFKHRFLDNTTSLSEQLQGVEVVVDWQANPPLELAEFANQIKLWQFLCVGTEKFDYAFWSDKLSRIEQCPSYTSGAALGEHALMMMLLLLRRINAIQKSIDLRRLSIPQGEELEGKRILILGFGASGKSLAKFLRPFNVDIRVLDLQAIEADDLKSHGTHLTSYGVGELLSALSWCDIVSVHVPLSNSTRNLIGEQAISAMKPGSYIINVSRGGIVDELAIERALDSGHLSGAAFDVIESEPIDPKSTLLSQRNVIVTPHIAGNTRQTASRRAEVLRKNLVKYSLVSEKKKMKRIE